MSYLKQPQHGTLRLLSMRTQNKSAAFAALSGGGTVRQAYAEECFPALRDFLGYMEVVKGRSTGTVEEYFLDLRTFFRFMKRRRGLASGLPADGEPAIGDIDIAFIKSITLLDVYEFLGYAKGERRNDNKALARKTTALRTFFKHLTNYTHQLDVNPIQDLETPKAKKTLPKYLTLEQSIALLSAADGKYAERDYCMLVLLLNCGLRRAELASLNVQDIRGDNTLRVLGKGNKERILYLNDACIDALEQYLPTRPVEGVPASDRRALFYGHHKRRISLQGVHYIVKGYLSRVDGLEGYSTHKLRHTAATLMYRHGVDIRVLKEVLGHENLGTTEIYTHLSTDQLEKAAQANPLATIKPRRAKKARPEKENAPEEEDSPVSR